MKLKTTFFYKIAQWYITIFLGMCFCPSSRVSVEQGKGCSQSTQQYQKTEYVVIISSTHM